jgi:hypothetical protein
MALFANAKTIEAPKKSTKTKDTLQHFVKGLSRFAAINAAIKSLTALAKVEETAVKNELTDRFIKSGMERNTKPDNFEGLEGKATASCQLKIRSSASVLSEDEAALLKVHKVPFTNVVKQQEAFLINPQYTLDMELLARVEAALAEIDLPEDFILRQEEISVNIVAPESIDTVMAMKDEKTVRALLPLVTTLSVAPKIKGDFWGIIDEIVHENDEKEEAA